MTNKILNGMDKIALIRGTKLKIKPVFKLILIIIASHMGKKHRAMISTRRLMNECDISSSRAIDKYINKLCETGLLYKIPPSDGFKTNRYEIDFNLIQKISNGLLPLWERNGGVPTGGTHCSPFEAKTGFTVLPIGERIDKALKTNKEKTTLFESEGEKARAEIRDKLKNVGRH